MAPARFAGRDARRRGLSIPDGPFPGTQVGDRHASIWLCVPAAGAVGRPTFGTVAASVEAARLHAVLRSTLALRLCRRRFGVPGLERDPAEELAARVASGGAATMLG